ncbi:hypothetical protein FRC11_012290 [Ceratobasidium sp. 423]|nr:hypothetical protein FRC11_012290 [Ceratobasidium sp. 423]
MKSASSILSSKKDKYMLAPCSTKNKDVVVELCDDIRVDTVQLANFEFFSGVFKDIAIYLARTNNPHSHKLSWDLAGVFRAKNVRGVQTFRLYNLPYTFYRYIRIEFRSHYGKEYFCPVSLLRVYGLTQMEDWRIEEWKQEWQARRPAELTISNEPTHDSPNPSTEEPARSEHQEGEGIPAEVLHGANPSEDPTSVSSATNHMESFNSTLQTNDSGSSIPRNSSLDDRNPIHLNNAEGVHPFNSSSNGTDDARLTAADANAKTNGTKGTKSKAPGPASTTTPVLRATHIATPMPSTGGESIYRTIWNRLDMLERNSTLSLRYVEEQNQSVRQALRRLEEEVGRLRALTNREQQELQRSMKTVQQKQVEVGKRYEILSEQVNALTEELGQLVLEKRLGIAQLCLLTTVLVFMALTRGSRAETHLLSGMGRRVDSGFGVGRGLHPRYRAQSRPSTSERPFSWARQDRRSTGDISHQDAGGSPRTPVRSGSPPRVFGTPSDKPNRSPSRMESRSPSKQPTKGVHFPQGLLPFPPLRLGNANGVRRSQSMSLSSDQLVISPGVGKRPATGMKRLARTAHLHEVELDTQRRLRMQTERAENNDTDHQDHDTDPGAPPTLDSLPHNDTHRVSDTHYFVKQASTPVRKGLPTGLGLRLPPTQAQPLDNGAEWEDTDADLDADDSMQELVVEENTPAPRVPRLFSPPTPRTWGARRKARGFSVDTGSAIRMQCA